MVYCIAGGTHTGKTALAQRMVQQSGYFCLSLDHLKMGLIRSGHSCLTPESSQEELTGLLWPITREIIKTAIENRQNLILEGCYFPYTLYDDFEPAYRQEIDFRCIVFSSRYIQSQYEHICATADVAEGREKGCHLTIQEMIEENRKNERECAAHGLKTLYVQDSYEVCWDIQKT